MIKEFYPGYTISTSGTIASVSGRIISPYIHEYKRQIVFNVKGIRFNLAKVLASAFVEGFNPKKHKVNFINLNKDNVSLDNLAFSTKPDGYINYMNKTTIRSYLKNGYSLWKISQIMNIPLYSVKKIINT